MSGPHANGSQAPSLKQGPHGFVLEHREPVLFIGYGESGVGKSTDLIYTFPNGYYVGARGGVTKVGINVVGWLPQNDEGQIDTLEKLILRLPEIARMKCDAVIVDDLSVIAERSVRQQAPLVEARERGNKYAVWKYIADCLFVLRDHCRQLNIHAALNAHPMGCWVDNEGIRWKGGPWLPGRQAVVHFPPVCDMVLHAVRQALPNDAAPWEWPAVYKCSPLDVDWYSKDRLDVAWESTPMNLREIMLAGGYKLSRAAGLEWQEEIIEAVAQYVLQGNAFSAVWQWAASQVVARTQPGETRARVALWTARDARARVAIRARRLQHVRDLGLPA